jgi:hypothetical protein
MAISAMAVASGIRIDLGTLLIRNWNGNYSTLVL